MTGYVTVKFCERGDVFVLVNDMPAWSPFGVKSEWYEQYENQKGEVITGNSLVDVALRLKQTADMYGTWLKQLDVADGMLLKK